MIGRTISHYEITEKLGEGGMGVVYKARDSRLKRFVALKVLPPEKVTDPERKQRFVQEARSASALNHPNIVTVHDIDQSDGVDFIAMEYVEGKTLGELIGRKGLKLSEALKYAIQVADALAKAHAAGIVHRDLKPGNVMVTVEGRVKVLDFGLAKLTEAAPVSPEDQTLTHRQSTELGLVVGTASYMSPEQAEGKKVDARSDIFSFGSVLYEMLTGRQAFRRDSHALTLAAILHLEPPALPEGTPGEMERILARSLRKDPARRFQNMADLKVALEELKEESDSGKLVGVPTPARPRRWPRAALLAGAGVFLGAGLWLAWRLIHSSKAEPALAFTRLTSDSGLTTDPALSPDGKLLAYASDRGGNGNLDIWVQQVGGAAPIRVTEGADASEPAFSPDATRIAFRFEREGGGVYLVPALGGAPRKLAPLGRRPRFSPDGKWVAYWTGGIGGAPLTAGNSKVYVVPSEGGRPLQIASGLDAALYPVWAPDSRRLLVWGNGKGRNDWWVAPAEMDRQAVPAIPTGFREFSGYQGINDYNVPSAWMPGEDSVLFSAGLGQASNLWRIPISQRTWKVAGPPQRLTSSTTVDLAPAVGLAATGKTRIVFASLSETVNLWSLQLDANRGRSTGQPLRLTRESATDGQPSISRDGKRLAFFSNRSGDAQVWIKNLDSGPEIPLTFGPPDKFAVSISPDGSRVVYAVSDGARMPDYVVPAEGGAAEEICRDCGYNLSWSPDGGAIFYVIPVSGRIVSLDLKSRRTTVVAQHEQFRLYQPQLSPDGRWLAFEAISSANCRIYVTPFHPGEPAPESQWVSMTDNPVWDRKPRWSPDGRLLYFLSERDGFRCLWAQAFDAANKRPSGPMFAVYHSHLARQSMLNLSLSPLGIGVAPGKFIFNMAERTGNIWMTDLPH